MNTYIDQYVIVCSTRAASLLLWGPESWSVVCIS